MPEKLIWALLNMSVIAAYLTALASAGRLLPCGDWKSRGKRVPLEPDDGIRADYSRSLLAAATRQFGFGIPPAFGENNTKARVTI